MDTRTKILDSAQRLIQTRSFQGFSFRDIADEVGIRKASLYHHFESKDAIALAVLERAAEWVGAGMDKLDQREPSERLEGYFDMYRIIHGKGERMCPGDRSVPFSMQSLLPCKQPYTALPRCIWTGLRASFAKEWRVASSRSGISVRVTSPRKSPRAFKALYS